MSDFYAAIQAGIKSAQSAEIASREIDGVFAELDESVRRSTSGKVGVRLEKNSIANALSALAKERGAEAIFNVYLIATNDSSKRSSMATVSRAATGYPVQIVHERIVTIVNDGAGLKSALSNVLSSTDIGRSILTLASTPQLKRPVGPVTKQANLLKKPRSP